MNAGVVAELPTIVLCSPLLTTPLPAMKRLRLHYVLSSLNDTNIDTYECPLCSLPVECGQAVLCHLPDLQAPKATILSHSALYSAFSCGQRPILQGI